MSDNGPGIPKQSRAQVLEPFFKLNAARTDGNAGFGLGLSIVAEIVQAHRGTLELLDGGAIRALGAVNVSSRSPGGRSRRTVSVNAWANGFNQPCESVYAGQLQRYRNESVRLSSPGHERRSRSR
ncbi:sensor histidine kinase (plasmid) [Neorhizobium galegae]|nr:sensor histidine kinase [Neorhizobium galegae]